MSEYSEGYADYQSKRSLLRKFVRKAYLNNVKKRIIGNVIDLGCGVGELLSIMPKDSIGIEINPFAVDVCRSKGLNVLLTEPNLIIKTLEGFRVGRYQTLVISHVLEHLDNPDSILLDIMSASARIGIVRLIVVVPGMRGFRSDPTHRTFIDTMFLHKVADSSPLFSVVHSEYFPINTAIAGDYFTHNELLLVYEAIS